MKFVWHEFKNKHIFKKHWDHLFKNFSGTVHYRHHSRSCWNPVYSSLQKTSYLDFDILQGVSEKIFLLEKDKLFQKELFFWDTLYKDNVRVVDGKWMMMLWRIL